MNVKAISANVGKALLVSALFMLLSCGVSIFYGLDSSFAPLLLSFIITFSVGIFPLIFVRDTPALRMHEAFVTIVLSWLLSFLLGMLPYILWGGEFSVINAWFESVSGYTTTGATILKNVEALPKGLLFWRSSTQYIGGFGVVVFLMMILPTASPLRMKLANLEISSLSRDGYSNRSAIAAKIMLSVYLGLSLLCFLSFLLAGMPIFDAINHTLTVLPNGGFSVKNASIGYYDSTWINLIVMFFTTICAIHFGQLYASLATRSFKPLNTPVVKYFLACIAVASVVTAFSLKFSQGYESWGQAFMDASFAVVNYITTAGFCSKADTGTWPILAGTVLMFVAFQCGCSGSTSGGLKADRILLSFRAVARQIRHSANPSEVSHITLGKHTIKDDIALGAIAYTALYALILVVSYVLLLMLNVDREIALSGTISSLSNVGPGLGAIGSAGNYGALPGIVKFIFSINMMLGRLEIYPVLVVVSLLFRKQR